MTKQNESQIPVYSSLLSFIQSLTNRCIFDVLYEYIIYILLYTYVCLNVTSVRFSDHMPLPPPVDVISVKMIENEMSSREMLRTR